MTETVIDIRNRLRAERERFMASANARPQQPQLPLGVDPQSGVVLPPPAFALEDQGTGRITVSTPLSETAGVDSTYIKMLKGRLVGADKPNRNGAFWTQGDLQFGLPTVANGPLNVGHKSNVVVGTLLSPKFVEASDVGPHIETSAMVWRWVRPDLSRAIEDFVEAGKAWLSMECVAQKVQCTGPNGCGMTMGYSDALHKTEKACEHVRERASYRRMVNPMFLGAAVILPPVEPAWADADLSSGGVLAEAEAAMGQVGDVVGDEDESLQLLAAIRAWTCRVNS